jgi:membrane protein required for colicin V production
MNGLDWFLIGVAIVCLARGMFRGAVSQLFGIAGVIGGFLLAAHSYESVAGQLARVFPGLPGAAAASFIVIFLLTWFCIGVAGYWIGKLLRRISLGFLDRLLGGAVGMAKAFILAVIVVALLTLLLPSKSALLAQSYLTPFIQQGAQLLLKATPESLQKLFEERQKAFRENWLKRGEKSTRVESPAAEATKS